MPLESELPTTAGAGWTFRTRSPSDQAPADISAGDFARALEIPGEDLAAHRTGRVWMVKAKDGPWKDDMVVKTYTYPTPRDRRRGILRNTFLARSRVRREGENLHRLAERGLNPPLWVLSGEARRLGMLHASFLVTRHFPGTPLATALPSRGQEKTGLLERLGRFVARMHDSGYVDRDLHLRNLLVDHEGALAKIDCPRGSFGPHALQHFGRLRDLRDLTAELRSLLDEEAATAFRFHYLEESSGA